MVVELVQVTTGDGVKLDGALLAPRASDSAQLPVDAVLCIHGTGGSFYSSSLFESVSVRFAELGLAVLRVNTRGHDGISTAQTSQGGRQLGAAYELVDDCRKDLHAWVDDLGGRGYARIALLGHSLGAVKCLYAMAHEPAIQVSGVVAFSPPRLSYSYFCDSSSGAEFLETYRAAERNVEVGRSMALMEVSFPLPMAIAAAGYIDKYSPAERYNLLRFVGDVQCPVLVTVGSAEMEQHVAFRGLPDALRQLPDSGGKRQVEVITGADHFYTEHQPELIARVERWLRSLVS